MNFADALTPQVVPASSTDTALGAGAGRGEYLSHIVIQPATTGAGTVVVKDGSTVLYTLTSGTLADLSPKTVPFLAAALTGFTVTTGANVTVTAFGSFS